MGSENALTQDLVFQLLQAESRERLGVTTTTDVLTHDFFTDIDIESVVDKSYMPSYIPQPSHPSSPAEAELSALPWVDSSLSVPINAFFLLSL